VIFLVVLAVSMLWLLQEPVFALRLSIFVLLMVYIFWETRRSKLLPDFSRIGLSWLYDGNVSANKDASAVVICFAGAVYEQISWTNRQHMMSRVAEQYPVLYIEPRIWIVRYLISHLRDPGAILTFLRRLFWYEKKNGRLFIKAQWNLIPGSREIRVIANINHYLNRWGVLFATWWLGFYRGHQVIWIYDTEAAEYLSAFPRATVLYDCVDDHAAQAGVDRNPERVREEEDHILQRADLVTVTSLKLLELKKPSNSAVQLVLNAGDVKLYSSVALSVPPLLRKIPHPRFGTVGTLDSYKFDFSLLRELALQKPAWHFILIGGPLVDYIAPDIEALTKLPNVHFLGAIPRQNVPAYVQQFDVCLIPYRDNTYNRASFPLKFWEFMATGKPIVVSGLPELRTYQPSIGYAQSPEEFGRLCEEWMNYPTRFAEDRIKVAREHSWEKRVERVLELLKPFLARRSRYEDRF
jgi:glycosyltransferase involved in cell wall biosynthesis